VTKRILIVVENLPVPFDSRVWKEASSLRDNGYEVTVLCPRGKGYAKNHEVLEGIRVFRHPAAKEGDAPLGYVWEYACALFWEVFYTWWIYLRHGFQVLQGCNPPDDIFLVALPFKLLGVKYIFDHHDGAIDDNPEINCADGEQIRGHVVGMKHDESKQKRERNGDGNNDRSPETDEEENQYD